MIDEKKLIEEIKAWQEDIHDNEHDAVKFDFVFERIYEILGDQPKVGEWIPCSERLPSETGEYLVWYDCGDDEEGCMVVNFDAGIGAFGNWYDEYDNYTLGFLDSEFIYCETAIAWMPLPEAYKGEK